MSIKSSGENTLSSRQGKYGLFSGEPIGARALWKTGVRALLLALLFLLSPAQESRAQGQFGDLVVQKRTDLPPGVQRMQGEILRAARSGKIERLREVLQLNELMPLINGKFVHDPVAVWKARSHDQSGREVLALLSELLELPPFRKKTKNGNLYIWPYFAGVPLSKLQNHEIIRLYRLVPAKRAAKMLRDNHYSHAVLTIGEDGTWHSFEDRGR